MGLDYGALIKKLNKTCLDALQAAAGLCLSRTNHSVEVEHGLLGAPAARYRPDPNLSPLRDRFLTPGSRTDPRHRPAQDGQRTHPRVSPRSTSSFARPGSWPRSSIRRG